MRDRRDRYAWVLAHLCHVTPLEVDELALIDFDILVAGCDQYVAQMNKEG